MRDLTPALGLLFWLGQAGVLLWCFLGIAFVGLLAAREYLNNHRSVMLGHFIEYGCLTRTEPLTSNRLRSGMDEAVYRCRFINRAKCIAIRLSQCGT